MNITEFFNTDKASHINAYLHLMKSGAWPQEFMDILEKENIEIHNNWQFDLTSKLATEYILIKKDFFDVFQ